MKNKNIIISIMSAVSFIALTVFLISLTSPNKCEAQTDVTETECGTVPETETETEAQTETETTIEPEFTPYDFIPLTENLQISIYENCNKYGIDYNLALAIIKTESGYKIDAIGDNGNAVGLCQIWGKWWDDKALELGLDLYNPADNVELMLYIISSHLDRCDGNLTEALQMYNTGKPDGTAYADRVYENLNLIKSEVN